MYEIYDQASTIHGENTCDEIQESDEKNIFFFEGRKENTFSDNIFVFTELKKK